MIVADYSSEAALRLKRVLTTDPGIGFVGHAEAGYPQAITSITEHKIIMPVLYKIPGE
jgi:urocanate hydratase